MEQSAPKCKKCKGKDFGIEGNALRMNVAFTVGG
jgi:hypothetical protein